MSENVDEKDIEALVEEQAKAGLAESSEGEAKTAQLDQRNSKISNSLLIEAGARLAG